MADTDTGKIYCDHSGDLLIRPGRDGERARGLVVSAAFVPDHAANAVSDLLPRTEAGGPFLKASSAGMTDTVMAQFASELLLLDVDVALVQIDAGDDDNGLNVQDAARFANFNRRSQGKSELGLTESTYWLFYPKAVIEVWGRRWERTGSRPNRFDLVFDSEQLARGLGEEIAASIRDSFAEQSVVVADVVWRSEQEADLLYVPDLLAGAALRHHRYGDSPAAYKVIADARDHGRVVMPSVEILSLPTKAELDAMGA